MPYRPLYIEVEDDVKISYELDANDLKEAIREYLVSECGYPLSNIDKLQCWIKNRDETKREILHLDKYRVVLTDMA